MNERLTVFVSVIFWRARHREANGFHGLAGFFSFPANPTQNSETEYCSLWGRHGKEREQWAFEKKSSPILSVLAFPNLSGKLRRGSLRYQEAVELADVLDYDIVWVKRKR